MKSFAYAKLSHDLFVTPQSGGMVVSVKNFYSGSKKAYAKINLGLDIGGKTDNGYHQLSTIMQSISLYDEVEIICVPQNEKESRITLASDSTDTEFPLDEKNTAFRAASAFIQSAGISEIKLDIHLRKRIPSQAGLGGASADAAAVLSLLNKAFPDAFINRKNSDTYNNNQNQQEKLMLLAAKIGADVPFCMIGGTCLCQGIGEKMQILPDLPKFKVVLIKPPAGISTPWAFARYDELQEDLKDEVKTNSEIKTVQAANLFDGSETSLKKAVSLLKNDLEIAAAEVCGEINACKCLLQKNGALYASMSGSGSCVYGIFPDKNMAVAAYENAKRIFPENFFISLTNLQNRTETY